MSDQPKAHILVVDDTQDWRAQLGGLLQSHGYEVFTAKSAKDAQRHFNDGEVYDLAIIDMRLVEAEEDNQAGIELGFWIRNHGHDLPIIILTAYSSKMETEKAQEMTLAPYSFTTVKKDNIGSGDHKDLFYQIERKIPWPRRSVRCFVIMPFHKDFDVLFAEIHNKLDDLEIDCLRVDKDYRAGSIPSKIRKHLHHNTFVIADLTNRNPNVFYELGYAHALGRPTILLAQSYDDLPEDFSTFHTLKYDLKFSSVEQLKVDLAATISATINDPSNFPRPSRERPLTNHTYVQFIPDTTVGQTAKSEVINPVIKELGLQEQLIQTLFSNALRIEENWLNIQSSSIIIAEISEGDPNVYYHVGASDALKEKGVFLLIRQGNEPPFNLKGRANSITYDPSNFYAAKEAQKELKNRIQACLDSYTRPISPIEEERSKNSSQQLKSLQQMKDEMQKSLEQLYEQLREKIDRYTQNQWSADERQHRVEDTKQMKQYIGKKAESLLNSIQSAETIEYLDALKQQLVNAEKQWYNGALKQIMR